MNKIEVYKMKKGTIRKYDETIKLNRGSYLILVGRIKIFLGTCENGKHLCDNYLLKVTRKWVDFLEYIYSCLE